MVNLVAGTTHSADHAIIICMQGNTQSGNNTNTKQSWENKASI